GDVVVVVTRYFGGTLLGTGGLVRAYGDAVKAVLAELHTAPKVEITTLLVSLPYPSYGACKQLLPLYAATISAEEFATDITLTLTLPVEQAAPLAEALREATSGAAVVVHA
ncbi:MAG: YigZ family protein, partial [Chloroflexales bacterium]|nr:YigZ family protein [Chloroflexales bacterium]